MKLLIVLSFSALAIAQTNSNSVAQGVQGGIGGSGPVTVVPAGGWAFSSAGAGHPGGAITGVPYSAEEVTERVQTLADGTHITQPGGKVKFYRDSQGRTRTERTFPMPPGAAAAGGEAPTMIDIFDPVTGARYMLEARTRTARKMSFPAAPPPPNPTAASANRPARVVGVPGQATGVLGGSPAGLVNDQRPRPQFSRESLGTQMIEGVMAEGTRTTVVYPIGAIGNDRPITTVSETWMSPELKTVVLSRNSDPRNGDSTTTLTNISRAEPDPALFQVPPDYQVVDAQSGAVK